jgi:hypothetical protein
VAAAVAVFATAPNALAATTGLDPIRLSGDPAPATPGWDYVTGRGTPDISAFVTNP